MSEQQKEPDKSKRLEVCTCKDHFFHKHCNEDCNHDTDGSDEI